MEAGANDMERPPSATVRAGGKFHPNLCRPYGCCFLHANGGAAFPPRRASINGRHLISHPFATRTRVIRPSFPSEDTHPRVYKPHRLPSPAPPHAPIFLHPRRRHTHSHRSPRRLRSHPLSSPFTVAPSLQTFPRRE